MINRWTALALALMASPLLVSAQAPPAQGAANQAPMGQSAAEWQRKQDMALKYPTLEAFYAALKAEAKAPASMPDWSGLWTSAGGGNLFRPGPGGVAPKLTAQTVAELKKGEEMTAKGIVYDDNLSQCGPAGFPRWMNEPFLREFIVTPTQTLLINEQANEIRRIYTDGRQHPPVEDQYPLAEGDSIGFWDGQKLVIHTTQLQTRPMGRNAPTQSDKMQTVEIWERVNPNLIAVDLWVNDPALFNETWYVQRRYSFVPNPNKDLRIRYWDCTENPNNDVTKTEDGGTDFKNFTFGGKSDNKSSH